MLGQSELSRQLRQDQQALPEFQCAWDADKGVEQFYQLFRQIDFTLETFEYRAFTRLKQLQYLIRTGQVDNSFFWIWSKLI